MTPWPRRSLHEFRRAIPVGAIPRDATMRVSLSHETASLVWVRPGRKLTLPAGPLRILRIASVVNGGYGDTVVHEKSGRFEMVTPPGWMEKIDDWRRRQTDIPTRAEAIRRLVEKGLGSEA